MLFVLTKAHLSKGRIAKLPVYGLMPRTAGPPTRVVHRVSRDLPFGYPGTFSIVSLAIADDHAGDMNDNSEASQQGARFHDYRQH